MVFRIRRVDANRFANQFNRRVVMADLVRYQPEQMQCCRIATVHLERLAIKLFGLAQAAGAMVLDRDS
ncbi:MAG TPA: hypothetical protein VGZ26_07045 [Pirellulales bacterium]|nr:hypothetical protein [Pirellulales bacterium]